MTVKERLHELIESLDDAQAEALLPRLETELSPVMRRLTEVEMQRIRSAFCDDDDAGMSTEQLLESLGIAE
jgi:hypothetical protein